LVEWSGVGLEIFGVIKDISLLGYLIRTFIVGIISFIVGRYMMKRTINQLTAYDFTLAWILGALTVAPLLDGEISFTYIIVPLVTLFFWHYIVSIISLRNRSLSFFFNGKPIILIDNGKIIRKNLKKQFINIDLLLSELRLKNIFDISEVKYVILEPNGHFSIIKKEINRSVTPTDFKIYAKPVNLPLVIINDGKLFEENLKRLDVDKEWLMNNLSMYNIDDIEKVYLATIDNSKKLYVSKKDI
jgi:uncharacterized membrane protein YcaP (DUF421 family)